MSRHIRALLWTSLWLAVLLGVGFPTSPAYAAEGDEEYKAGKQAELRENYDEAFLQYEKALNLDPGNPQFYDCCPANSLPGGCHARGQG